MEKGFIAAAFFVLGITTGILVYYGAAGVRERRRKKRELQERRRFQRIEELQSGLMEEKREELAKIRHDFNNQLAAAYRLIEQGERDSARGLLDHMRDRISANREYQYCGNAIVDAVIIEKEAVCREWHIPLSLELEIYEEQNIEPAHLCSVFSNLLDNAIRECAKVVQEGRKAVISIKLVQEGTALSADTTEALSAGVLGARRSTELVERIAESAEQQVEALRQLTQGMEQISNVVQTNAATAEKSASSASELLEQAHDLKGSVQTFRLRQY